MLSGRPEERFKFAIGLLTGSVIAIPLNVLNLTNWNYPPELAYTLAGIIVLTVLFRKRTFIAGGGIAIIAFSLPQALAALAPTQTTLWHITAGLLWLLAFAILGCLYLMREAETRTNADVGPRWLLQSRK